MIIRRKHLNWIVILFFVTIIAVVFQQILTSMTAQGIASGGPYDNAAAYPKAVAVLIAILVAFQAGLSVLRPDKKPDMPETVAVSRLKRPAVLLLIFALYLGLLDSLGYHLTTAPMIFTIMLLCGMRLSVFTGLASVLIAFGFAFAFEVFLKVVLPGGMFGLNIPW